MELGYRLYCDEEGKFEADDYKKMVEYCKANNLCIEDHRPEYFEVVEIPKLTYSEKVNQVRSIRSQYMSDTLARCDRYEKQKSGLISTTDTYDTYSNLLKYLQYLRDVPQSVNFPNEEVLTFDEWGVK